MKTRIRVLLVAALVLASAMATSSAQASRAFQLDQTRIVAIGNLTTTLGIQCRVTITMNVTTNPIPKVSGTPFAAIDETQSSWADCTGFTAGRPNTGSFLSGATIEHGFYVGTLPSDITSLGVRTPGFSILLNTYVGSCLWSGSSTGLRFDISRGRLSSLTFSGGALPRVSGGALCPANFSISGPLMVQAPVPNLTLI